MGFARLEDHWEVVAVPVVGPVLHPQNDRVQIVHREVALAKATMAIWHVEQLLHTFKNEKAVRVPIAQKWAFLDLPIVLLVLRSVFLDQCLVILLVLQLLIILFRVPSYVIDQIH